MVDGRTHRPVIDPERCGTCDACAGGCPAVVIREYRGEKDSLRGALFANREAAALLEGQAIPACQAACPIRQETRRYLRLIAEGRFLEALDVIRDTLPFPGIIGRICHHPCEQACLRGKCLDEPLTLCGLKRFVADYEVGRREPPLPPVGAEKGKTVAVIGGGPSGMACALALRRMGYGVTIFEKEKSLGGVLYWGIPAYRLPREVLNRETAVVLRAGVQVQLNTAVGTTISLKDIRETFDALYIACGAQGAVRLGINNETSEGVLSGIDFLRRSNGEGFMEVARNVVVVGGGNVAIDAALSAGRRGAEQVTLVCLEPRGQMSAGQEEVQQTIREGIVVQNSWGLSRILVRDGRVTGIETKRCIAVFDESGRFNPRYDDRLTQRFEADMLIIAIGQVPETEFLEPLSEIKTTPEGWIAVDPDTLETSVPGIFSGGDIVTGPRTAIDAIEAGQRAAQSIARHLAKKRKGASLVRKAGNG